MATLAENNELLIKSNEELIASNESLIKVIEELESRPSVPDDYEDIKSENSQLKEENSTLQSEKEELSNKNNQLEADLNNEQEKNSQLTSENELLTSTNTELNSQIDDLTDNNLELAENNRQLAENNNSLSGQVDKLLEETKALQSKLDIFDYIDLNLNNALQGRTIDEPVSITLDNVKTADYMLASAVINDDVYLELENLTKADRMFSNTKYNSVNVTLKNTKIDPDYFLTNSLSLGFSGDNKVDTLYLNLDNIIKNYSKNISITLGDRYTVQYIKRLISFENSEVTLKQNVTITVYIDNDYSGVVKFMNQLSNDLPTITNSNNFTATFNLFYKASAILAIDSSITEKIINKNWVFTKSSV